MKAPRWSPPSRVLRTTRQSIPELGQGCAGLGNLYTPVSAGDAAGALNAAWAGGLRYFDTAPYYGHGLSEYRLGRFLRSDPRRGVIVSSKVGRGLRPRFGAPGPDTGFVDTAPFEPYFDYGYDAALRQIEASLERLGRTRLDIAYVHDLGGVTHGAAHGERFTEAVGGAFRALAHLKREGVVGAVGLGVNEVAVCLEALDRVDLDVILLAGRYTLLDQSAAATLLPLCLARGVGVVIGGPYNSGVLAGGGHYDYAAVPVAVAARARRLEAVCAAYDVALPAAALRFPLRHPAVISVIPGGRGPAEVEANIDHFRRPPPDDLWRELEADGLIVTEPA